MSTTPKGRRRRLLLAAASWGVLAVGVPAVHPHVAGAQPAPAAVSTQAPPNYQLVISATESRVTVPLSLGPQVNVDSLAVTLEGIRRGDSLTSGLEPFFQVPARVPQTPPGFDLVVFTQKDDRVLRPGTYQTDVRATWTEGAELKPGTALIPVKVTVPAASITASGSITVKRTTHCLLLIWRCGKPDEKASGLTVEETSELAPVRKLKGDNRDITGTDPPPGAVSITVGTIPDIPAGERGRKVPYTTEGNFPIGSTKGKLRLTSPSLDKPLDVDWTLRARRGPWTYAVLILLGAGLGALVRKGLSDVVQRGEHRDRVDDLLARLRRERDARPDQEFQKAVTEVIDAVKARAATDGFGDATKVASIVTDAQAALKNAVDDLAKWRAAVAGDLLTFRHELRLSGSFSEVLGETMTAAEADTASIEELINRFDATGAKERLRSARQTTLKHLAQAAAAWRALIEPSLVRLERPDHPVPSGTKTSLDSMLAALRTHLRAEGFAQPASVTASQQAVGSAVRAAQELLVYNLPQLSHEAFAVRDELRDRRQAAPEELVKAITALGAALKVTGDTVTRLDTATLAVNRLLSALHQTFGALAAGAADATAYAGACREGRYLDAARTLGEAPLPATVPDADADDAQRPLGGAGAAAFRAQVETVTIPTVEAVVVKPDTGPPLGDSLAAPSGTVTALARFLRWAIMALIVVIVGMVVLPESIDGTRLQLLGVFLWAFTVDAAYAGLLTEVTKFGAGPKAPA